MAAAGAAITLLELLEQDRQPILRDARAGIRDRDHHLPVTRLGARESQAHADAAAFGELDGVAGEVDQDLPHPVGVAQQAQGHVLGDVEGDLDTLVLGAGRQQLDHALGERRQVEGLGREIETAGLDPGEVEHAVDQAEQRLAAGPHGLDIGALFRIEIGPEDEIGHSQDAVERRTHLVADGGQEARFRDARRLGLLQGGIAAADRLDARRHVPAGAQPVHRVAVRHRHLHEGEPADPSVDRADLRLHPPHAVLPDLDRAALQDLQVDLRAEQRDRLAAEEPGEILVGVGDAAARIPLDDDLRGRRDQGTIAVLALADPPEAVVHPLGLVPVVGHTAPPPASQGEGRGEQECQDQRDILDHPCLPGGRPVRCRIAGEAEGGVGKGA